MTCITALIPVCRHSNTVYAKWSLTWNDLQHSVLLHVGWQVACSHLVVLNLDGCQFLEMIRLKLFRCKSYEN